MYTVCTPHWVNLSDHDGTIYLTAGFLWKRRCWKLTADIFTISSCRGEIWCLYMWTQQIPDIREIIYMRGVTQNGIN